MRRLEQTPLRLSIKTTLWCELPCTVPCLLPPPLLCLSSLPGISSFIPSFPFLHRLDRGTRNPRKGFFSLSLFPSSRNDRVYVEPLSFAICFFGNLVIRETPFPLKRLVSRTVCSPLRNGVLCKSFLLLFGALHPFLTFFLLRSSLSLFLQTCYIKSSIWRKDSTKIETEFGSLILLNVRTDMYVSRYKNLVTYQEYRGYIKKYIYVKAMSSACLQLVTESPRFQQPLNQPGCLPRHLLTARAKN